MDLDEAFAAADSELAAAARLKESALAATAGQESRLAEALAAAAVPRGAAAIERAAAEAEAAWLDRLPETCRTVTAALEAAKPYYMNASREPTGGKPARKGLLCLFRRKKAEAEGDGAVPSQALAQAAFVGREKRIAAAFALVDEALEHVAARRPFLDEQAFRFQESALSAAKGKDAPEDAARAAYAAEEMATVLADHSAALALRARVLEAVDRSSQGVEDEIAAAAEAALDRILEDEMA